MFRKLALLTLSLAVLSYLAYRWVSSFPEMSLLSEPDIPVTAANGEKLFWGKGTCHVCHKIGKRGYALRGPNLGHSEDGPIISDRAVLRADSLRLASGLDYLVQTLAEPAAFVVPGFNNEMPQVFRAPIALFPSEIKAIIAYLFSLGGDSLQTEIVLPRSLLSEYETATEEDVFVSLGNPEPGRELFFDQDGPAACAKCHIASAADSQAVGTAIGPDLGAIATIRSAAHIHAKIVNPDSNIVSGYQQVLAITAAGLYITGLLEEETGEALMLRNSNNQLLRVSRDKLRKVVPQPVSMMPGNYKQLLTEGQVHDLVAFLLTLKGTGG